MVNGGNRELSSGKVEVHRSSVGLSIPSAYPGRDVRPRHAASRPAPAAEESRATLSMGVPTGPVEGPTAPFPPGLRSSTRIDGCLPGKGKDLGGDAGVFRLSAPPGISATVEKEWEECGKVRHDPICRRLRRYCLPPPNCTSPAARLPSPWKSTPPGDSPRSGAGGWRVPADGGASRLGPGRQ
jgi:hypothetical protein